MGHLTEQWASPEWRDEARSWVDAHVARTGELDEVRMRPWGHVLSAPTEDGTVFLKATAAGTAFEPGLYAILTRVVPDRVLQPIALDVGRGWLLLPDGGPVLRDQHQGAELAESLIGVAGQYAQLQLDLAPHVDELFAAGVADMRPARMLERFDEAVAAAAPTSTEQAAQLGRISERRAVFASWCSRLGQAPGEATLDHNDLHGGNVFLDETGRARFFDWGDAVVAHPFASALVLRSVVRWLLDAPEETPAERRVIDAYLEPFGALASKAELLAVVDLACEIGKVARSLVWLRAVADLPPDADDPDGFRSAPTEWLLELLEGPLGQTSSM